MILGRGCEDCGVPERGGVDLFPEDGGGLLCGPCARRRRAEEAAAEADSRLEDPSTPPAVRYTGRRRRTAEAMFDGELLPGRRRR